MKTDYKFWYIKRDDNGFITDVSVRFFEGELQTINNKQVYIRTKRLEPYKDLKHLERNGRIKIVTETNGNQCVYYHQDDFGKIKTDTELEKFLEVEIKKDKTREFIK